MFSLCSHGWAALKGELSVQRVPHAPRQRMVGLVWLAVEYAILNLKGKVPWANMKGEIESRGVSALLNYHGLHVKDDNDAFLEVESPDIFLSINE